MRHSIARFTEQFLLHFSLVTGAVVWNPFKLKVADSDMDPTTVEFQLDSGSTDRFVRVKNEVANFESKWGFGIDVEINVPISKELGYLFVRGTTNHVFDPNPWGAVIGYTLPLNSILGKLRGK